MVSPKLTLSLTLLAAAVTASCGGALEHSDPLEAEQWYLHASDTNASIGLSDTVFSGRGIVIAIVDDGIERSHEDLAQATGLGHVTYLPPNVDFGDAPHGTAVAGIIAAVRGNGIGGRGIAPEANLIALNAVRTPAVSNFADALARNLEFVDVSQNSWGDFNAWGEPFPLHPAIAQRNFKRSLKACGKSD
jgi:subtilisin family serine protease